MTKTHVWLVRHGHIMQPKTKIFVGQTDLSLSAVGQKQMLNLRNFFSQKSIAAVLCSDLSRCQESAKLLCPPQVPIIQEPHFREIHLGNWEGKSIAYIQKHHFEEYTTRGENLHNFRPEQGESFIDLDLRVHNALKTHLHTYSGKNILMVAHAGVNRVILARYLHIQLKNILQIPQPYGCYSCIQY